MKILNCYAGIGGNRKLWGDEHEITAVELNPDIAGIYKDFFPNDTVIVGDAHQYLLDHYHEYNDGFIWSSLPCQTHSRARYWAWKNSDKVEKKYPDMRLYEEILFLQHFFKGLYCIENTKGYYIPLITPQEIGRHYFWSNFPISKINIKTINVWKGKRSEWEKDLGLSLKGKYVGQRKDQILRNCVEPELGLHILQESQKGEQGLLFGTT